MYKIYVTNIEKNGTIYQNRCTSAYSDELSNIPFVGRFSPANGQTVIVEADAIPWETVGSPMDYEYTDGEFFYNPLSAIVEPILTPAEQREQAYETQELITYEDESLTVDEANKLWLEYTAEGDVTKAQAITVLIATAKSYIRTQYPDEE